jgi:hypothetical protein
VIEPVGWQVAVSPGMPAGAFVRMHEPVALPGLPVHVRRPMPRRFDKAA